VTDQSFRTEVERMVRKIEIEAVPSACTANASCGTQKDWAAVLDQYNNGLYPGGPGHCGDE
jgi:hypothetical protein